MNYREMNIEICRALGIDAADVTKVVITIQPSALPTIEVTRMVKPRDVDGLQTVVEMLKLKAAP